MSISVVNGWHEEYHYRTKPDAAKDAASYKAKGYKTKIVYTKPQWVISLNKFIPVGYYALWIKRK